MRIPPGGGPAQPFATGVRNGTGLAIAPDGSVWTAVNNRDNVANPQTGEVTPTTSTTTRPRPLARLDTWAANWVGPTAIPTAGPANLPVRPRRADQRRRAASWTAPSLPPVEQSSGAHSAPLGMSFTSERAARRRTPAVRWSACTDRGTAQPPRAPEVVVLPLAERHSRQPADSCRRLPGRRRHRVGAARSPR